MGPPPAKKSTVLVRSFGVCNEKVFDLFSNSLKREIRIRAVRVQIRARSNHRDDYLWHGGRDSGPEGGLWGPRRRKSGSLSCDRIPDGLFPGWIQQFRPAGQGTPQMEILGTEKSVRKSVCDYRSRLHV